MKKVISHMFSFIKHLFLRLRLVITLSIGKDKENEDENSRNEEPTERSQYDSESNRVSEDDN